VKSAVNLLVEKVGRSNPLSQIVAVFTLAEQKCPRFPLDKLPTCASLSSLREQQKACDENR